MLHTLAEVLFPGACPGCGARAEPICAACADGLVPATRIPPPPGLDACIAAFAYAGAARELVARVKYRNRRTAVPWLADAMVAAFGSARSASTPDVVTWVPTSPERRRARGFDHAELLARAVGTRLRLPTRSLLTRGAGPAQTGRSRRLRVEGPPLQTRVALGEQSVLLVDDVLTTGATLRAGAQALRVAGAHGVQGLVAAWRP